MDTCTFRYFLLVVYFRLAFLFCLDKIALGWKEIDKTKKRPDSFLLKHKSHSQLLLINVSPLFSPLRLHSFLIKLTFKHFIWDSCGQKTEDANHIRTGDPTCTSPIFRQDDLECFANQTLYQISVDVYDNYHNTHDMLTNPSSLH